MKSIPLPGHGWIGLRKRHKMTHTIEKLIYVLAALVAALLLAPKPIEAAESVRPESDASYVIINPMNISIIQNARVRGMLQVELGLDIPDDELRATAIQLAPRLQDAYVIAMRHYTTNQLKLYQVPNANLIGDILQNVTTQVLGGDGAIVLLSQIMLHKPF